MASVQGSKMGAGRNITNIPKDIHIYKGANQDGQIQYEDDGLGYSHLSSKSWQYRSLGARATLALGLTESCAIAGRGKVYYMTSESGYASSSTYPESYMRLPSLLYVHHLWDDESRQAWFDLPHWQRLDFLTARANALHWHAATMPISLTYETGRYETTKIIESEANVALTYNKSGIMYLGFVDEITQSMSWSPRKHSGANQKLPFWLGPSSDLGAFKVTDGPDAAMRLAAMYQRHRRGAIRLFETVLTWVNTAHDDWAAAGGYSIEADPVLGPEIAAQVETILNGDTRLEIPAQASTQLQELRAEQEGWSADMKRAFEDYSTLAVDDLNSVEGRRPYAHYMIADETWNSLTPEERMKVVELFDLEQINREERGGTVASADNADSAGRDNNPRRSRVARPSHASAQRRATSDLEENETEEEPTQSSASSSSTPPTSTPRGRGRRTPTRARATPRGRGNSAAGRRAVTTPALPVMPRGASATARGTSRGRGGRGRGTPRGSS